MNEQPPAHEKTITITVNGRDKVVPKGKISYETVVALAYPNPDYNTNNYTVTYFRSANQEDKAHEGTLTKDGKPVEVKDGMVFTVVPAVRS
jgi:hypothetical protein